MTIHAFILRESPIRLWSLSSRDRLQRVLKTMGITEMAASLSALPKQDSVVLLRGDYLFDNRVIQSLVETPNVVLQVPAGHRAIAVAAHVPGNLAAQARLILSETSETDTLAGVAVKTPQTLSTAFQERLRKAEPPFVLPITEANRRDLEKRLFASSYKGVTDFITKWLWPRPAQWVVGLCASHDVRPNHVTLASLLLVILAGMLFNAGHFGWGLAAGWLMTFLDTVDGKLARVTVTSSRFGHIFDHAIDLIHPPLWYMAWGWGLGSAYLVLPGLPLSVALWAIVIGYIAGRLVEATFQLCLGRFGIFCWRPADSYFRLVTARRNPNMVLLTGAAMLARPDLGLLAVALWTLATSVFLLVRLVKAFRLRLSRGPLRSWLSEIEPDAHSRSLAVKLFTRSTRVTGGGPYA